MWLPQSSGAPEAWGTAEVTRRRHQVLFGYVWEIQQTLRATPLLGQFLNISYKPVPGKNTFPDKSLYFLGLSPIHLLPWQCPFPIMEMRQILLVAGRLASFQVQPAFASWPWAALRNSGFLQLCLGRAGQHISSPWSVVTQGSTLLWVRGLPLWQPSLPNSPQPRNLSIRSDNKDNLVEP